jgi:hypothetical protein
MPRSLGVDDQRIVRIGRRHIDLRMSDAAKSREPNRQRAEQADEAPNVRSLRSLNRPAATTRAGRCSINLRSNMHEGQRPPWRR